MKKKKIVSKIGKHPQTLCEKIPEYHNAKKLLALCDKLEIEHNSMKAVYLYNEIQNHMEIAYKAGFEMAMKLLK